MYKLITLFLLVFLVGCSPIFINNKPIKIIEAKTYGNKYFYTYKDSAGDIHGFYSDKKFSIDDEIEIAVKQK